MTEATKRGINNSNNNKSDHTHTRNSLAFPLSPLYVFVFLCFILHSCCINVSMVGWTWWDWSLILWTYLPSVLWHCWLGHLTRKNPSPLWPIMCWWDVKPYSINHYHHCNYPSLILSLSLLQIDVDNQLSLADAGSTFVGYYNCRLNHILKFLHLATKIIRRFNKWKCSSVKSYMIVK